MFNVTVQKYFNNVIAWLWNIRFNWNDHAHLSIGLSGSVGAKRNGCTLEDGQVAVVSPHADAQEVVQRFAMNDVNNDITLKKIWIDLHLHTTDLVNKLAR